MDHEYNKTNTNHCVLFKKFSSGELIVLLLYVDDMLEAIQDNNKIEKLKREIDKFVPLKDLGLTKQILGIMIIKDMANKKLPSSQEKYIEKVHE